MIVGTEDAVRILKRERAAGRTMTELSQMFRVSPYELQAILNGGEVGTIPIRRILAVEVNANKRKKHNECLGIVEEHMQYKGLR